MLIIHNDMLIIYFECLYIMNFLGGFWLRLPKPQVVTGNWPVTFQAGSAYFPIQRTFQEVNMLSPHVK